MAPRIIRKSLIEGARSAEGLAVVIDVFRAFSCAPLFLHFGCSALILEADPERARAIKRENPSFILVGEVDEVPIEGGDLTNSPTQILKKGKAFFEGRTVIHRTTAGVVGVRAAWKAGAQVILGSFLMGSAIRDYVLEGGFPTLTLVAMGSRGLRKSAEDEACADYIEALLTGAPYDHIERLREIIFDEICLRFTRGGKEYLPPEDPIFCLQRDLFSFVITVRERDDLLIAEKAGLRT
jgi:2-phosphosulfolactate phosphatase